jgi:hypothetical protein
MAPRSSAAFASDSDSIPGMMTLLDMKHTYSFNAYEFYRSSKLIHIETVDNVKQDPERQLSLYQYFASFCCNCRELKQKSVRMLYLQNYSVTEKVSIVALL